LQFGDSQTLRLYPARFYHPTNEEEDIDNWSAKEERVLVDIQLHGTFELQLKLIMNKMPK
jgi:hypothetical protein